MPGKLLLQGFSVSDQFDDAFRMPFLAGGPVGVTLRKPLTLLVGENGCGKTTLLAALAAKCSIRPGGGRSFRETDDERDEPVMTGAVQIDRTPGRIDGLFLRADTLADQVSRASRMRTADGMWRKPSEQSRGEGALSLLASMLDASEGMLFLLDEPETGLSPQRQMALLCQIDNIHRDGRSQAVIATHSPILMSHPHADILWIDERGIDRRELGDVQHWRDMKRFMRDPDAAVTRLLSDD